VGCLPLPSRATTKRARAGMKLVIKWGRQEHAVEVDTEQPPSVLKLQLYSLTGVPPDRQKILVKGGQLKDDADWAVLKLRDGQKVMMMGSAEKLEEPTPEAVPMQEDGAAAQEDAERMDAEPGVDGTGLVNLGNTCYMNSCLQCMYSVPQLREAVGQYAGQGQDAAHNLTAAARGLFRQMSQPRAPPVTPYGFLGGLRAKYPQFAQQQNGVFAQQDAEECWTQIMYTLREKLDVGNTGGAQPIKDLFGLSLRTTLKSEETGEEYSQEESLYSLKCNITQAVNHVGEGIRLGLVEDREKHSEKLGKTIVFKGESQLTGKMPEFLTVQLVRFLYRRDTQQKAKILRPVTFPQSLDLYNFCDDGLKKQLDGHRTIEDAPGAKKEEEAGDTPAAGDGAASSKGEVAEGPGFNGKYTLQAVLTHKGRIADAGHYVAWVRQEGGKWALFDDDKVSIVDEEEIEKLKGGGDWHTAYLTLYRADRA